MVEVDVGSNNLDKASWHGSNHPNHAPMLIYPVTSCHCITARIQTQSKIRSSIMSRLAAHRFAD
jgi:hypothetical protein